MSYATKGVGKGEIEVDLNAYGVPHEQWETVIAVLRSNKEFMSALRITDTKTPAKVQPRDITVTNTGWVKAVADCNHLSGPKLSETLQALEQDIIRVAQARTSISASKA